MNLEDEFLKTSMIESFDKMIDIWSTKKGKKIVLHLRYVRSKNGVSDIAKTYRIYDSFGKMVSLSTNLNWIIKTFNETK
jgi:hypothetical protein